MLCPCERYIEEPTLLGQGFRARRVSDGHEASLKAADPDGLPLKTLGPVEAAHSDTLMPAVSATFARSVCYFSCRVQIRPRGPVRYPGFRQGLHDSDQL